jgi:hypothetical protein
MDHRHSSSVGSRWRTAVAASVLAFLGTGLALPASAQTITVSAKQLSAIGNLAPGQEPPRIYDSPVPSISGWCVIGHNEPNWTEYAFDVATAGVYSVKLNYATPLTGVSVTLDVHLAGSAQHYAVYGVDTPSTGDWVAFKDTAAVDMPLAAGTNIIRVENVGAFNKVPRSSGRTGNGLNIGGFTLTRTGSLPSTGTISGTISSSDLGVPVGKAIVMAVAPSKTVAAPGYHWYNGYWTLTTDSGSYSLAVPAGSYTVQAGRPDTYVATGATVTGVVVTAGGSTPANASLASRWASNSLTVQMEDYAAKTPDVIGGDWSRGWGTQTGTDFNGGISLGWIDAGDFAVLNVDVSPSGAGWYRIGHIYQNGGSTGSVTYATDRGSVSTDSTPPTGGWGATGTKTFANLIYLFAGRNEITVTCNAPNSNFDAFTLTKASNTATKVRVEAEDFVNYGSGAGASVTGGSGGTNRIYSDTATGKDGLKITGTVTHNYSTWSQENTEEYVEYTFNAPQDGLYDFVIRGACPVSAARLRLWNLTCGAITDEYLDTSASMGWVGGDMAQFTGSAQVPLIAGPNRLRMYITDAGMNNDWFEFTKASDLAVYGVVGGVVTANGAPVAWAQVSAETTDSPLGSFRATTDSLGRYRLLAPVGAGIVISAIGPGYGTPATATVDVSAGTPATANITLTPDAKYEAENWTNAFWAPTGSPVDHGLGVYDDAAASNGQALSSFNTWNNVPEWVEYAVTAPVAGLYNINIHYATDFPGKWRVEVPETGTSFVEDILGTGGWSVYSDQTLSKPVALKAGVNTLRFTTEGQGGTNLDYLTLTNTGQTPGTLRGTVYNATVLPKVVIPDVTITVRDGFDTVVGQSKTGADGTYSLLLPAGTYTVIPAKTGFEGAPKVAIVSAGGDAVVDFDMTQGLIKGYVTNQMGEPIQGTKVIAYESATGMLYDPNNANYDAYKLNQTFTDSTGYYEMAVRPGSAFVVAGAPMSIAATKTVNANPVAVTDLVVTRLAGGTTVDLAFNHDWFSDPEAGQVPNGLHDVDGLFSLPANPAAWTPTNAVGPTTVTLLGVPFKIGNVTGNELNVISLDSPNNVITVPHGRYAAAVILGTSSNGNWPSDRADQYSDGSAVPNGGATINYTDNTSDTVLFALPNWGYNQGAYGKQWRENAWEVIQWAYRWVDGYAGPEYIKFNGVAVVLPCNPAKTVKSVTLTPDPDLNTSGTNPFVFAVTMANDQAVPLAQARKALAIAAGLSTANAADLSTLNVVTAGSSAGRIDLLDAAALAKAGL